MRPDRNTASLSTIPNESVSGTATLAHAAALSSLSAPRATIFSALSGSGRCSGFASSRGALIQAFHSSSVVRIADIAFGWISSTMAFGAEVRSP